MKLNKKGYMLIEIILATAIAFGIAYFILSMTIKLKNKNDDLLVETLVATDQAIIANAIMANLDGSNCTNVNNKIKIEGKKIKIDDKVVDVTSDYITTLGPVACKTITTPNNGGNILATHINIPISVKQLNDRNFNIKLDWIDRS